MFGVVFLALFSFFFSFFFSDTRDLLLVGVALVWADLKEGTSDSSSASCGGVSVDGSGWSWLLMSMGSGMKLISSSCELIVSGDSAKVTDDFLYWKLLLSSWSEDK